MVGYNVVNEPSDNYEIGLCGFGFNLFDEYEEGGGVNLFVLLIC